LERQESLEHCEAWRCRYGHKLEGNPISPGYVQQRTERYATKARISKSIHPYTLRHSLATALCRKTARIRLAQKAQGHASQPTTQIYTHIVDEELEDALKPFRQPTAVAVQAITNDEMEHPEDEACTA